MRSPLPATLLTIAALCVSSLHAKALDTAAAAREIDTILAKDWAANRLEGNPVADDNTLVRRIYLDVAGRIPTTREAEDFLGRKDANKRAVLIDQLLASEGYVQHAFNYWADVLRAQTVGEHSGQLTGYAYTEFIKQSLRENKPYDQFVRELVTAQGAAWNNGAIGYYLRDRGMPLDNMATTVRIFAGTRIECAQCHDHPFEKWTQLEFYKMGAYTYGVELSDYDKGGALDGVHELMIERKRTLNASFKKPAPPRRMPEMTDEQFALLKKQHEDATAAVEKQRREAEGEVIKEQRYYKDPFAYLIISTLRHARSNFKAEAPLQLPLDYKYDDAKPGATVEPAAIFGGQDALLPGEKRFDAYARWLTRDNARFNSVLADRLWKRAFGLSPIEPLDELLDTTKPMIPELQQRLEKLIVEANYDMKAFLRVVYNTSAYQRQVTREEIAPGSVYHFTGPILRRMSAEQMWDSFIALINPSPDLPNAPAREAARQRVVQGKKMNDALDALGPGQALQGIAAAGRKYEIIAGEVIERQKGIVAARARAKELGDRAKKHPDDAGATTAATEAARKLDELTGELRALNNDARRTVITEVVIPAEKKLYEKVTGKPFPSVAAKTGAARDTIFNGGDVMKDAMLEEVVPIPGYDTPQLSDEEREVEEGSRRERYEEEARYYGIKKSELSPYLRAREEQSRNWLRAAEIKSPASPGHYLREFGQSDRETVENANDQASITQALAVMNGQLLPQIMNRYSQLMLTVSKATQADDQAAAVYLALLSRQPTSKEKALWREAQAKGLSTIDDLIFSLLNTQQFIFVQ